MSVFLAGALRWRAPELCGERPENCSIESDIWAYGCVLIEIATKAVPWKEFSHIKDLLNALSDEDSGARFQAVCRHLPAPDGFRKILHSCCTWLKKNRTNFDKIIRDLRAISSRDIQLYHADNHSASKFNPWQQSKKRNQIPNEPLYSDEEEETDGMASHDNYREHVDSLQLHGRRTDRIGTGRSVKADRYRKSDYDD